MLDAEEAALNEMKALSLVTSFGVYMAESHFFMFLIVMLAFKNLPNSTLELLEVRAHDRNTNKLLDDVESLLDLLIDTGNGVINDDMMGQQGH